MTAPPRPPALFGRLLRLLLGAGAVGRSIRADLEEEYASRVPRLRVRPARRWYRREASGVLLRTAWRRARGRGGWEQPGETGRARGGLDDEAVVARAHAGAAVTRARPDSQTITVLTLGLGIGANAAVFSVVDAVLLKPLPFPSSERLVAIRSTAPGTNTPPSSACRRSSGTAALMLVVAWLASYLPARRASSVDPVSAIRSE